MNWSLKIALIAVFSLVVTSLKAQDLGALEIGTALNYTLISDDLGLTVDPQVNEELVIRYNFPYRIAFRGSFAQNFKYTENSVWDLYASSKAALGLEYHFKDFNIYDHRSQISPYLMIGFSYQFNHQYSKDIQEKRNGWDSATDKGFKNENNEPLTVDEINDLKKGLSEVLRDGGLKQFGVLASLGLKYKVTSFLIISAELSAVYFGSDEYDREKTQYLEDSEGKSFLNNNGNDWYLNPNLSITIPLITFGPKF